MVLNKRDLSKFTDYQKGENLKDCAKKINKWIKTHYKFYKKLPIKQLKSYHHEFLIT